MYTIKRGTHTSKGGNPPIFLTKLCHFFDLEFSKGSYSRALAPPCSALVAWRFKGLNENLTVSTFVTVTTHADISLYDLVVVVVVVVLGLTAL